MEAGEYRIVLNETMGEFNMPWPSQSDDPSPFASNSPFCPVIGYQVYKDDGQGNIVGASQPNVAKLTEESTSLTPGIIINNELAFN
jgi:hypothetical protein